LTPKKWVNFAALLRRTWNSDTSCGQEEAKENVETLTGNERRRSDLMEGVVELRLELTG